MLILGIETSCDETSIAVVEDGKKVLSNVISSQIEIHKQYGGVVPEIASRHHIENIYFVLEESLKIANKKLEDIDYIAVTYAPGLIGALLVGVSFAKSLSYSYNKPLLAIHHLKGHVYSNFIDNKINLPAVCLIVSGGHTILTKLDENHDFHIMGETYDDAVGEVYDKVSRIMDLGYPGGPAIDKLSKKGVSSINIPEPKVDGYDFSFSGIKTYIINYINNLNMKNGLIIKEDIAKSFQERIVNILVKKSIKACIENNIDELLIAGGVSANSELRESLSEECKKQNINVHFPALEYCTDNAAMIASAAYYEIINDKIDVSNLNLDAKANKNF